MRFEYASLVAEVPEVLCRQFRIKITGIKAAIKSSRDLVVSAEVPIGMNVEPLHVAFKGPAPDQDVLAPIAGIRTSETGLTFTASIPPGVDEVLMRHVRLAFETHGRYSTQKIKLVS